RAGLEWRGAAVRRHRTRPTASAPADGMVAAAGAVRAAGLGRPAGLVAGSGPHPGAGGGRPCRVLHRPGHALGRHRRPPLRTGGLGRRTGRGRDPAAAPGLWRRGLEPGRARTRPARRRGASRGAVPLHARAAGRRTPCAGGGTAAAARRGARGGARRAHERGQTPSDAAVPAHGRLLGQRDVEPLGLRRRRLAVDDRRPGRTAHRGRSHAQPGPPRRRALRPRSRAGCGRHLKRRRQSRFPLLRSRSRSRSRTRAMTLKNTPERWGAVSQALHWLVVLLILAVATVGLVMDELPRTPKYFWVYTAHKSLGITVLALMLLRLGWRLYAGGVPPVAGTPRWQATVASATHWLLYALALAMPLSGWLYDSASGLRPF